jgi:DHA3 family macrolide efflux protein-like MFS transporter
MKGTHVNLVRNRNFMVLLFATFTSQFGDILRVMALTYWVFVGSGSSPVARAVQLLLFFLPSVVLSPLAGVFSDRWDRRHIMIASDLLRALISGGLVIAILFHSLALTFVLIILGSTVTVFFEPARFSLLPQVVKVPGDLTRANSLVEAGSQILAILGPGVATLLYFALGGSWAFALDAASFLVSALAIRIIRFNAPVEEESEEETASSYKQIWKDALFGLSYLCRTPAALFFLLTTLGLTITATTNQVGLLFLITLALKRPVSDLAWVFTVSAAAQLLTALVVTVFAKRLKPARMLVLSMAIIACTQVGMGLAPNTIILVFWVLLGALANAPYSIAYDTVLQQSVEASVMGRVYGVISSLESGVRMLILGAAAVTILQIGPRISITGAGVLGMACALIGALALLPAIRRQELMQMSSREPALPVADA